MRWLAILPLALLPFVGCSLAEALENAPCDSDDDCLGDYTCVKTLHQSHNALPGLCRDDGQCAAGTQEGCIAAGGGCEAPFPTVLTPVNDGSGNVYCCETVGNAEATLIVADDFSSARCIACPADACMAPASEPCGEGDARCVVEEGSGCGCRVPAADIENSLCDDAESCGEGFVCTRTLEQEEEPDEEFAGDQEIERGWCRPLEAPECVGGQQEGCRTEDACVSEHTFDCVGTECYCCDDPTNSTDFAVHVYAQTDDRTSAACIECEKAACPTTDTCTLIDNGCLVEAGEICGCMPEA